MERVKSAKLGGGKIVAMMTDLTTDVVPCTFCSEVW